MPGIFGIYELGRHGLLAQQVAISTAGHNIANAGTPGFHRQRISLTPTHPELTPYGALGTGVRVDNIQRVEDRFIEFAIQRELPLYARFATRYTALEQTELVFGEPSESGVTAMLDQFYTAWDDLASSPEDAGARESVVRMGVSLADTIRAVRSRLTDQKDAINGEINQTVDDANRVIRELQILNRNILTATAAGNLPGDMEDQRDTLIARLGELVGATGTIEDDGTAIVRIGGRVLVQLEAATEITYDPLRNVAPALGGRELGSGDVDGKLGGLIEVRDDDLVTAVARLDEFAYRLASDVNAVHEQGTDTYGNPAGPFFVLLDLEAGTVDSAAGRIRVSATLQDDSRRIAAGASTAPGDNSIALDIAALRNDSFGASGMLDALVVDVGARAREAKDLALGQEVIVNSFKAQRESVSGVSLDEEAANLLRYQRSYEAAARLMTIADEMAQTILAI